MRRLCWRKIKQNPLETARKHLQTAFIHKKSSQNLTEKEVPQEHPFSAWGLLTTWNELRISSWLKSTMEPFTKARLSTSTTTRAPPCSNTLQKSSIFKHELCCRHDKEAQPEHLLISSLCPSKILYHRPILPPLQQPLCPCLSSGLITVSKENLYWNPEQPPPSTCSLRNSDPSAISSSLYKTEEIKKKKKKQTKKGSNDDEQTGKRCNISAVHSEHSEQAEPFGKPSRGPTFTQLSLR